MQKTKRQLKFFSFYDFPAIEKHLADMAAEGWMVKSAEGAVWKYEQIEPKRLHFAVTYFPKAHALDPEPPEELIMLWDFCEHTGWKLAVQAAQLQIFYNEAENPRPIETDPVTQLENIHRAAKKSILTNLWAGLFLGPLTLAIIGATERGLITDSDAAGTYTYEGRVWEYYEDELPLTVEDLTGEQYEGYSYQLTTDNTIFLTQYEGRQRARFDAENFRELPDLEYTITQVKTQGVYELCKKDILDDRDNRDEDHVPEGHKNLYEARDPAPWGAVEAYQLTAQDSGPLGFWLLCYKTHFVELVFYGWDPTIEQMTVVAEKLGSISQ